MVGRESVLLMLYALLDDHPDAVMMWNGKWPLSYQIVSYTTVVTTIIVFVTLLSLLTIDFILLTTLIVHD